MNREKMLARMCARKQVEICNTPRVPSDRDRVDNRNAVRMCVLIAMLNSAMYDLRCALDDGGMFKHKIKRDVCRVHDAVCVTHSQLSKIIGPSYSKAAKQYNSLMDVCVEDVNNAVLIDDPVEKQYNICVSLCRLVGAYNDKLKSRYRFIPAAEFSKLESILKGANISVDDNIDFIVDSNITIRYSDAN
jgi:hypothetical protein